MVSVEGSYSFCSSVTTSLCFLSFVCIYHISTDNPAYKFKQHSLTSDLQQKKGYKDELTLFANSVKVSVVEVSLLS